MADQRDPWEVYSAPSTAADPWTPSRAAPTSIRGPRKEVEPPKPYEVETDAAQLRGQELQNQKLAADLAKTDTKPAIDPKVNASLQTDDALAAIAKARQLVSGWSTGVGGQLFSNIGGTDSRDLATTLSTVKSGITLGKLAELKSLSEKGASGLGALSDNEARLLADSVAGIDQFQSSEGLLTSLDAIEKHYRNVLAMTNGEDPRSPDVQKKYGIISTTPDGRDTAVGVVPPVPGGGGGTGNPPQPGGGGDRLANVGTALGGGTGYTLENDPALAGVNAEVANRVGSGQSTQQIAEYLRGAGIEPDADLTGQIDNWTKFIKANPSYRGAIGVSVDKKAVPTGMLRDTLNSAAQSPLGTAAVTSADALTGFQLPRLTGNAALGRAGIDALSRQNPTAALGGTLVGGVAAGAGLEGALGRAGVGAVGALAPRLLASDAIYGGVASNGLNPEGGVTGAALGALVGAGGGIAARAGVRALGGLVSPTGGDLPISYAGGARPSIGQRFGREGTLGETVNKAEQAMMSLPGIGSAIKATREGAREGWETAGINNALREIGSELPAGVERGPEAMAFMRQQFGDVYDRARSGMQFVPDQPFQQEFGAWQQSVVNSGVLDGETRNQLEGIVANTVGSRMRGGTLAGDAYKTAISDLGDAISRTSSKPELQAALKDFRTILDNGARRNSQPEAVALMDAADRGYSQYKPMRDASAMAGSEPGRFTPTALASVERRTKGKTAAYVEGNTRMGDYVNEGMALRDTMGNSFTTDRALIAGAATGAGGTMLAQVIGGPVSMGVGAALGGLAGASLPGVRRAVGAALAPRTGALVGPRVSGALRTLGDIIRERQTALGYAGAPLALEYQQQ